MSPGRKYQPLSDYLRSRDRSVVTLSFAEIEAILQDKLPASARSNPVWWSNRSRGAVQAKAWMEAGYLADRPDLEAATVTFRQPPTTYRVQTVRGTVQWNGELVKALRRHMGLTQTQLAEELGVRQQTISEWEKDLYQPTLATSKHLGLVAEKASFQYKIGEPAPEE